VAASTGGAADSEIPVKLNTMTMAERWDLNVNIGHVVPHEVPGFANQNKNYLIGLSGKEDIWASRMAAAVFGNTA
jgi:nickel-dependent lactate racemase